MKSALIRIALVVTAVFASWLVVDWIIVTEYDSRPGLHYTIRTQDATAAGIVRLGEPDAGSANEYAWRVQALSVTPTSAVLRVQLARFPDLSSVAKLRAIEAVTPQQVTYKACDQLTIPVDNRAPLVLSGFTESPCHR